MKAEDASLPSYVLRIEAVAYNQLGNILVREGTKEVQKQRWGTMKNAETFAIQLMIGGLLSTTFLCPLKLTIGGRHLPQKTKARRAGFVSRTVQMNRGSRCGEIAHAVASRQASLTYLVSSTTQNKRPSSGEPVTV